VLVATFLSARLLGVHDFGLLASLQGLSVVCAAVTDLGTSAYVARQLAANDLTTNDWKSAVSIRLYLIPIAIAATAGSVLWGASGIRLALILVTGASVAMNVSALTNGALQGQLRFRASALSQCVGRIIFMSLVYAVWANNWASLSALAGAFFAGEMAIVILQVYLLRGTVSQRLSSLPGVTSLLAALPYWLNSVFNLIYNRADTAIVALLAGASQAGLYAPASSIQSALMTLPGIVTAGLPSVAANVFGRDRHSALGPMFRAAFGLSIALGFVSALAATVLAPQLLRLLAGENFVGAVLPTQILSWSLPFYAAELALFAYLIAIGRPGATTWGYGTSLVTAVVGLMVLAPQFGAVGAAVASLLREPVTIVVLAWLAVRAARSRISTQAYPARLQ
jgi:O-antigen/teichoic acid export membrane protein